MSALSLYEYETLLLETGWNNLSRKNECQKAQ